MSYDIKAHQTIIVTIWEGTMKNKFKKEIERKNVEGTVNEIIKQVSQKPKSVRTTFTITKEGNEALSWIISTHIKKIGSIIDLVCKLFSRPIKNEGFDWAVAFIERAKETKDQVKRDVRRTMVLSDKSLFELNSLAKKHGIPRDVILDRGFCMVFDIMKHSSEVQRKVYEEIALKKIKYLWAEAEKVERELKKSLNEDDPVLIRLGYPIVLYNNLCIAIENYLENGTPIDPDLM
jgi:hypothetical protein